MGQETLDLSFTVIVIVECCLVVVRFHTAILAYLSVLIASFALQCVSEASHCRPCRASSIPGQSYASDDVAMPVSTWRCGYGEGAMEGNVTSLSHLFHKTNFTDTAYF